MSGSPTSQSWLLNVLSIAQTMGLRMIQETRNTELSFHQKKAHSLSEDRQPGCARVHKTDQWYFGFATPISSSRGGAVFVFGAESCLPRASGPSAPSTDSTVSPLPPSTSG